MKLLSALALALLVAAPAIARAEEPTAAGFWEAQDDNGNPTAWFLFTEKNDVYSARLVKGFRKPGDTKPIQKICVKCTGEKKGAHIMGLTLFWGMKRDGLKYRNGSVLDPRDGSIYHAQMDLSEDGKDLAVRGYLGLPIFGKTQVWHRLPEDAMKKDDVPKEILANGESPGEKKPHAETAEKSKAHKAKLAKAKAEKAKHDAEATPDEEPALSADKQDQ